MASRIDLTAPGTYVDVKSSGTQQWFVGYILESDPANGAFILYDGFGREGSEWVPKTRLAPFRRHTRGYTGPQNRVQREWIQVRTETEVLQERLNKLFQFDFSSFTSPYSITQIIRGQLFTFIDELTASQPRSMEDQEARILVGESVMNLMTRWLEESATWYPKLAAGREDQELYLNDELSAFAHVWPELFMTVTKVLGFHLSQRQDVSDSDEHREVYGTFLHEFCELGKLICKLLSSHE